MGRRDRPAPVTRRGGPPPGGRGRSMRQAIRAALGTSALRRLSLSWTLASVGGWCFMVALSVYAYGEGGAAAVGVAALVRMIPAAVAAPLAGVLADRRAR